MAKTDNECDLHWYMYLIVGLILGIAFFANAG